MLSVYSYTDPHLFLKDMWSEKSKKNPNFSIRGWAKQLGLQSHNPLYEIVHGKRPLPKKYIPNFIKSLELSSEEGMYFETLVDLNRAKTVDAKELYATRLKKLSPRPTLRVVEIETYKYLQNPLHGILLELCTLKDFKNNASWIKDRLHFSATINEIEDALERLITLGLLVEDKKGYLKRTERHLSSKHDVKDLALQEYHKRISQMASRAISEQDLLKREYGAYMMNIKMKDMPKIKEFIRKFINDFISEFEASNDGDETYCLNTQLFSLSRLKKYK